MSVPLNEPRQPVPLTVVSPTFHPEKVGTPHYVSDLVVGIHEFGIPVQVVTNQPFYPGFRRFRGYGRNRRHDEFEDVPVHRLPTIVPRQGHPHWRIASEVNMVLQVWLALVLGRMRRSRSVIAVSPGAPAAILAGCLLRSTSGQLTVVVHDVGFGLAGTTAGTIGRSLATTIRRLEVWALNRADRITVLSGQMARVLKDAGVVTPMTTVELWPTIEPVESPPDPKPTVVYSGNLGRKQGIRRLLGLAAHLEALAPRSQLIIRGDGTERERLIRQATEERLANVTFEPLVPASELSARLAEGRVHVVPQLPEASEFSVPSKIVNILVVGRPVVVTADPHSPVGRLAERCPAVSLVAPGDDQAFAHEVSRILSLPGQEYSELCDQARAWAAGTSREDAIQRTLAAFSTEGASWGQA